MEQQVPLHELAKIVALFPDKEVEALVSAYEQSGTRKNDLVKNPYYPPAIRLFVSAHYESGQPLSELLVEAIKKKCDKNHGGKENTVLIIDNRTGQYDSDDYFEALEKNYDAFLNVPFPEIWFYTGYFSDDNGDHAEFSFSPLKVTDEQRPILREMANDVDKDGRFLWSATSRKKR